MLVMLLHNTPTNDCDAAGKLRRPRRWPGLATLLTAVLLQPLLQSCGGGGGGEASVPAASLTPTSGRVSADSAVAAACTGGGAVGVLYANAEVEPSLARSSTNPQLLLAAWQQDRWSDGGARAIVSAVSQDGGAAWTRTLLPLSRCGGAAAGSAGDFERASDPWVDVGSDGVLHVMGLAFSGAIFAPNSRNAMLASRSTDGGRSWSAPQTLALDGATFFNDKNTLTVDPLDPRFVYAVWDRLDTAGNGPTLLARSTDAGLSWEPAREIYRPPAAAGGTAQTIGNRIVVLTGGALRGLLVNVFTQIDVTAGVARNTVRVQRSTDGGTTWSTPVAASHSGTEPAFTPTLHVREDGLVGLLYFDLRPDTADTGTLLAASWLATSRDGLAWADTVVWTLFNLAQAPMHAACSWATTWAWSAAATASCRWWCCRAPT